MQIDDLIAQMGGIQSMARELGVSEQQAASGAAALLPAILGGFQKKEAAQGSAADGLGALLSQLGGGRLQDEVQAATPTDLSHGNAVLGQIFGSKDVSRTVAQHASAQSGVDPSILKKMLPMLAMLAAGYMARQRTGSNAAGVGGGALGGLLGGLLSGAAKGAGSGSGGGLGGLLSMLDSNKDGNPLDDILRMAGKK